MDNKIHEQIKEYYGVILGSSDDLKTNACCCSSAPPRYVRDILPLIDEDILNQFYGCGSPIPMGLEGCTALDLGCGTGRDVFILSKLVGENGHVHGVDMTESQLAVARKYQKKQAEKFGYSKVNTSFHLGYIEDLKSIGIEDESVDVVTSNCVINLSPFKEEVFREVYRILKQGGEMYFSDVFSDRRVPKEVQDDPVMRGECTVEKQRGSDVFDPTLRILRKLNELGYGKDENRKLTLVYNTDGPYLPPNEIMLEDTYRDVLREDHGIEFTNLIAIGNVPLGRFGRELRNQGKLGSYIRMQSDNFNEDNIPGVMCRDQINVDYDGCLYDCEYYHVLGLKPEGAQHISELASGEIASRKIHTCALCYSCTAGYGSSCGGNLSH